MLACCELGQLALRERAERRLSQPAAGRTKGDLRNILSVRGAGCLLAASWDNSRSGSGRSAGCPNLQQSGQKVIYEIFSVFVEQDACLLRVGTTRAPGAGGAQVVPTCSRADKR